jgi:hypothetical protein
MSKVNNETESTNSHSVEELEKAIKNLEGKDRVGSTGQVLTTVGGAAAGGVAAGSIAAVAGASTLLGSTTLASALGGIFVVATPVGWIAGCTIAGAAAAYGLSKMLKSGGRNDRVREELIAKIQKKLNASNMKSSESVVIEELQQSLSQGIREGKLSEDDASRLVNLVELGKLNADVALLRVKDLIT